MKILVTGGAGFIGSRMVGRLLDAGDEVHVVDDFSLGRRVNLAQHAGNKRLTVTEMDILTPAFAELVVTLKPQRVFHMAANSDIQAGTKDTRTDLHKTFLTTFHVLDAMRRAESKEVVFASTSAIYGEADGQLREEHGPLQPISLYGASKLASEAYLSAYSHLFNMRAWVFRFPNVVGPNLTHGAVYDFVRRLHRDKKKLSVLGNGTQLKPYLHVDDLLDAIFTGVSHPANPLAVYNVAGEGATTVREIAEMVRATLGFQDAVIEYGSGDRGWPGDVPKFAYDTSRIRALGWKPRMNSNQAVQAAVTAEVEACRRSS
ncbi:MAG: NAD-dependent epimerase/dehydratase family protein [Myxococcota bacterium]